MLIIVADHPDKHTTSSATHRQDDHEQNQVMDSLQQLHLKLDSMAKHFGINAPGHKNVPSLISAHRDSNHGASPDAEHHQQMDSLISQVVACTPKPTRPDPCSFISGRWTSHGQCAVIKHVLNCL